MEIGNIQFRIGLIIGVLILGGVFAGALLAMRGVREEKSARDLASHLSSILASASTSNSRIVLSFGEDPDGALSLSPTLGGEHYTIHVLPSLIYIDWKGGREIVTKRDHIIPAFPPASAMEEGSLSELKGMVKGFSIRTPSRLVVQGIEINASVLSFVHPDRPAPDTGQLEAFISDGGLPPIGFDETFTFTMEDGGSLGQWMVLVNADFDTLSGSCGSIVTLPPSWELRRDPGPIPNGGSLKLTRRAYIQGEDMVLSKTIT